MHESQAYRLSHDISAMQSTLVDTLRGWSGSQSGADSHRVLYARWYSKRVIAAQLGYMVRTSPMTAATAPNVESRTTAPVCSGVRRQIGADHAWAEQVERYLQRSRTIAAPCETRGRASSRTVQPV